MSNAIEMVIRQLSEIPLFRTAGHSWMKSAVPCEIILVDNWSDAISERDGKASGAFSEAVNRLTLQLSESHRKEYRKWNAYVREVHEEMGDSVFKSIDLAVDALSVNGISPGFREQLKQFVRWDFIHYAMEQVYSSLVTPPFYTHAMEIYKLGHFPCGWNEVLPNGKIWVY
ncbi:MAG: hypothetical protein JNM18_13690 [Planctomycetaceae bacterium]|nr:hypothetical protein [Planctomycetaceae bacterium]